MNEAIYGGLSITLPEGFRAMSVEELKRSYDNADSNRRGFWDEERHVIVVVSWNETNKLMVRLADEKSIAKRAEKHLSRSYASNNYHNNGFFTTQIAGRKAQGFRYGYTLNGVAHDAEFIVFLQGKCCYMLNYYNHSEDTARNTPLRDEIFASLSFS